MRHSISLLTLAFFFPVAAGAVGCVSNEYVIPNDELARLAGAAAETRGAHVHAVQSIGQRQADAVSPPVRFTRLAPPAAASPPPSPPDDADEAGRQAGGGDDTRLPELEHEKDAREPASEAPEGPSAGDEPDGRDAFPNDGSPDDTFSNIDLRVDGVGRRGSPARAAHGDRSATAPAGPPDARPGRPLLSRAARPTGGGTVSARGSASDAGGRTGVGGPHGVTRVGVGHGGGASPSSGFHAPSHAGGGGGGGGGGGDNLGSALVVIAVVALAVAALAMIGLAASEGARFDGYVDLSEDQPVHLALASGGNLVVPLGSITALQAAATVRATVMDNESPGLRLREHVLDRRGATFKLDFGSLAFERDSSTEAFSGLASHLQVGAFVTPHIGLMVTATLAGAHDTLGSTLTRHQFGLELQVLPFAVGPLHLGGFADGGVVVLGSTARDGAVTTGTGGGLGALLELDVTGRMALTLRGGVDVARFDAGWSPAATVAAGIAVY